MTAALEAPHRGAVPVAVVCLAGMGVLLARPWLVRGPVEPTVVLILAFVGIGVVGAWWPLSLPRQPVTTWPTAVVVAAAGTAAFAVGRVLAGGGAPAPPWARYVVLNSLAAVAEEAFFRRLVYDALSRYGPPIAVAGSAASFTIVHVTVWGVWVLPLDLAAGLLLSWQRWASGRWSIPALTHVAANLLAVL